MDDQQGGGRGPQPDDEKRPDKQTDASNSKPPQRDGNFPKERWDTPRGSEPSTRGSSGPR